MHQCSDFKSSRLRNALFISVASKRGCSGIKHFQIESSKSQGDLVEDLSVLAMLTLPYEFQFQWHYWMELPMRPKPPGCDEFIDIIFRIGMAFQIMKSVPIKGLSLSSQCYQCTVCLHRESSIYDKNPTAYHEAPTAKFWLL